jgi:hypothetical protein
MLSISNYHYIREYFDAQYPSIFGITPNLFKNQLKLLLNQADFINPKDLLDNAELVLKSKTNYFLFAYPDCKSNSSMLYQFLMN